MQQQPNDPSASSSEKGEPSEEQHGEALERLEHADPKAAEVIREIAKEKGADPGETLALIQEYSGPVPPPSVLNGYLLEHAERILAMAEKEQQARLESIAREDIRRDRMLDQRETLVDEVSSSTKRGQVASVVIAVAALLTIIALLYISPNGPGAAAAAAVATAAFAPMAYQLIKAKAADAPLSPSTEKQDKPEDRSAAKGDVA